MENRKNSILLIALFLIAASSIFITGKRTLVDTRYTVVESE